MNLDNNLGADLDSILDATLDDLADMPEFKPFPAGTHRVTMEWSIKEINKQSCPELKLTIVETVELSNPDDVPGKAGDNTSLAYIFKKKDGTKNEIAEGQFKQVMQGLAESYGSKSPRELMAESQKAEVLVTTKVRTDKKDSNNIKHYTDLVALQVI